MDKKLQNKELFTKRKDAYVNSRTHSNPAALQKIAEWLKPSTDQIILDIATGGGRRKNVSSLRQTSYRNRFNPVHADRCEE